tara:strand:+ start:337 stop:537 length:201 start_codon:yes stop_codon:yes gene_type:complete
MNSLNSVNNSLNLSFLTISFLESAAIYFLFSSVATKYPAVLVSSKKKLIRPKMIERTGQTGFHDSG